MISKSRSTHRAMTKKHPSSSSQGRLLLRPSQEGGRSLAGTPAARSRLPASEQGQWLQSASPLHLPVTWLCCPLSTSLLPALQLPLLCCDYFLSSLLLLFSISFFLLPCIYLYHSPTLLLFSSFLPILTVFLTSLLPRNVPFYSQWGFFCSLLRYCTNLSFDGGFCTSALRSGILPHPHPAFPTDLYSKAV